MSNGANGNVAYGNRSVPLPEGYGNMDIPNIQVSDFYMPNWTGSGTCIRIYTPLTINNTAKRYDSTQSDYRNDSGPNYKLQFKIASDSSESNIETFSTFLSQMKKIELWFKYQSDDTFYKWTIVELDPSKWNHTSDYAWVMDSDYYTSTKGDFPGGTGNVEDTGITAYVVPFK